MKLHANINLEVKVIPQSESLDYYVVLYRPKKLINIFNSWYIIVEVYDGFELRTDFPVMFHSFDDAVKYAKEVKANPEILIDHNKKEKLKYDAAVKIRNKNYRLRNKSITI